MGVLLKADGRMASFRKDQRAGPSLSGLKSRFRERVTADGSSNFPAEAGRYQLYV
jgi:glutathionyl-hydroquinone reductase